ncbi:hypothetical protein CB1_000308008 [Camelus ferus]|nr:hypothetical protein CB1_000308008 [Camelus ferus]
MDTLSLQLFEEEHGQVCAGVQDSRASGRDPGAWDEMDQTPTVRSEYLVSGIRTPPVRRNSKLATLGRIFKPWKWRKKKNEKLKQTTSALEKKMAGRQGREDLIKKGLLEMMEQEILEWLSLQACEEPPGSLRVSNSRGEEPRAATCPGDRGVASRLHWVCIKRDPQDWVWGWPVLPDAENKACGPDGGPRAAQSEPSTPKQEPLTSEEAQPGSPSATGTDQASPDEPLSSDTHPDDAGIDWTLALSCSHDGHWPGRQLGFLAGAGLPLR